MRSVALTICGHDRDCCECRRCGLRVRFSSGFWRCNCTLGERIAKLQVLAGSCVDRWVGCMSPISQWGVWDVCVRCGGFERSSAGITDSNISCSDPVAMAGDVPARMVIGHAWQILMQHWSAWLNVGKVTGFIIGSPWCLRRSLSAVSWAQLRRKIEQTSARW